MMEDQIGHLKREFKPGLENMIAGIIIGILLIGGGFFLIWSVVAEVIEVGGKIPVLTKDGEKGWCWLSVGILCAVGLGISLGGVFLIRWVRSTFSFRVYVGKNGLVVFEKGTHRFIAWDNIKVVREVQMQGRLPLLKGPAKYALPQMKSRSFGLVLNEGEGFGFDGNTVKGHIQLSQMIKEETDPRGIAWEVFEHQI